MYIANQPAGLSSINMAFNALVKGEKFDAILGRFYENQKTKQLLIKMAQPKY